MQGKDDYDEEELDIDNEAKFTIKKPLVKTDKTQTHKDLSLSQSLG